MDMKLVKIDGIKVSTFNARKTFDEAKMKELTVSVKEKGIINPILIRPLNGKYELVSGERRMRAAVAAGLLEIPAVIRELTDQQALECMVIENLQREDVHPLEEAEGYEQLMKKHGYKDAKDIAAKVGKSPTYIYGRLKLCELIPENRKLFLSGKFSPSVALLVARIPAGLQKAAGDKVAKGKQWGDRGPMSYRDAQKYIRNNFMLELKGASFDTKDKTLCLRCGPCTICMKRTGNQKELFQDVSSADVCTDPVCFEAKKKAHVDKIISKVKLAGKKILSAQESKAVFPYSSSNPEKGYIRLDSVCYDDPKHHSYKQLSAADKDAEIVYALHPDQGVVVALITKATATQIIKKAGIKTTMSDSPSRDRSKDLAKSKTDNRVREAKRGLWISKVSVSKDQRCRNVITLDVLLEDLGFSEAEEILKTKMKTESAYGRCWDIPKLYELGDTVVQELIVKAIAMKSEVLDDDDLECLFGKLGFSMAKDYVITESYLQACTKDQLDKLAKELGIKFDGAQWTKKEKVDFVIKNTPKGKVPKEMLK